MNGTIRENGTAALPGGDEWVMVCRVIEPGSAQPSLVSPSVPAPRLKRFSVTINSTVSADIEVRGRRPADNGVGYVFATATLTDPRLAGTITGTAPLRAMAIDVWAKSADAGKVSAALAIEWDTIKFGEPSDA